jgi:hypothetical protein
LSDLEHLTTSTSSKNSNNNTSSKLSSALDTSDQSVADFAAVMQPKRDSAARRAAVGVTGQARLHVATGTLSDEIEIALFCLFTIALLLVVVSFSFSPIPFSRLACALSMRHVYQLDGRHEFEECTDAAPLPTSSLYLRANPLADSGFLNTLNASSNSTPGENYNGHSNRGISNSSNAVSRPVIDVTSPQSRDTKPIATKKEARTIYYGNRVPSSNSGEESDGCEIVSSSSSSRTNEFKYAFCFVSLVFFRCIRFFFSSLFLSNSDLMTEEYGQLQ